MKRIIRVSFRFKRLYKYYTLRGQQACSYFMNGRISNESRKYLVHPHKRAISWFIRT